MKNICLVTQHNKKSVDKESKGKSPQKGEPLDSLHPNTEKGPQKDKHVNQYGEQDDKDL